MYLCDGSYPRRHFPLLRCCPINFRSQNIDYIPKIQQKKKSLTQATLQQIKGTR
jgi:hypothetical protein